MAETLSLTPQMMVILGLLGLTIVLFVFEILRVDVAALTILVLLGLLNAIPTLEGIIDPLHLFDGFASNAVISVIAVMILGAGLDKTGIMSRVAAAILRWGGSAESRIVTMITVTVGVISGFLQNVGAVAVFMPVASRISARTGLPISRLLMPISFCAIMGGTLTLVGTSSTILLNDLLPKDMKEFGLFEQAPIGLALLGAGILYFLLAGRFVLPSASEKPADNEVTAEYFSRVYGLAYVIREMSIPQGSELDGTRVEDVESDGMVRILAMHPGGDLQILPSSERELSAGTRLALMGRTQDDLSDFAGRTGLAIHPELDVFADALAATTAGVAEVVIPPDSSLIGKSPEDVWMDTTYGLSVLAIHRMGETLSRLVRVVPLQEGDTLMAFTSWEALARLEGDPDFVVVTSEYPREELRPQKVHIAALFFAIAMALVVFSELRLSLALLVGALGMIIGRVVSIDEAYQAVSWKTVFLLAGLIPLGAAVQDTGTAAWIAQGVLRMLGDVPAWVLQAAVAVMATFFTLVMSNVGATVLLVPLAIGIATTAQAAGVAADPRVFALTVAIAASNSFLLPTHQCNALVMGPGGYRVKDFVRAGGIMTVIFLVVAMVMLNLVF